MRALRFNGLRAAWEGVPGWVILLLLGPILVGPVFILNGADVPTAAVVSLLLGPAVAIALIAGLLPSCWLLAGPVWLVCRLWTRSALAPPGPAELKQFTKVVTVGIARELHS